jgi:MFS family permease
MADLVTSEPAIEVTQPNKSWFYLFSLTLSVMVGGLSSVVIKQLLLPIQTSQIAPHNTNMAFTLVASIGAFAGLLASPLAGALSDRTALRHGRRRPWIALGIATALIGISIMAFAHAIWILLLGEIFAQVGIDILLAITTAVIPDQVPFSQRPFLSACVGMAPNVGGVLGLFLVSRLTDTRLVWQGYMLMALVSLLCVMIFLLVLRDPPVSQEELPPPFHGRSFLVSFVSPLRIKDFSLTFTSRCFAYLSFTLLGAYLLFYLVGKLHYTTPTAATGLANLQLLSTSVLVITAFFAGWLSKRLNRLKPFVIGGALGMAAGLGVMVAFPTWTGILIAEVIFGIGFGLYLGVDIALAVRVLPSKNARGKDLGIIYDAIYLPLIVSPLIGGWVLHVSPNNFAFIFALAACSGVVSAILIAPIKSTI